MKKTILIFSSLLIILAGCSIYKTFQNLSRLKFKLANVSNLYVAGVNFSGKNKLSDFAPMEILTFSSNVLKGTLPVSFTLNVEAKNPNDGTGGYPRTNATLEAFPYRLLIDNKEILQGNISSPFVIPGTGESSIIPLSIGFDLVQTFKEHGYESLINLALRLSGLGNGNSNVQLFAKPVVGTELGNISYPGELKIVEVNFSE